MKKTVEELMENVLRFDEDFFALIETHQDKFYPQQIIVMLIEKCVVITFGCAPSHSVAKKHIREWLEEFIKVEEEESK
jgi:hypothetical protein